MTYPNLKVYNYILYDLHIEYLLMLLDYQYFGQ